MINNRQEKMKEDVYSPVELLYSAYRDQQLRGNVIIEENMTALELYLAPLTKEDRSGIYDIFQDVFDEKERSSFLTGLRIGFMLAEQLAESC